MDSYWSRTLQNRLTRRRALAGAATIGAGALIAACGGDDSGGDAAPRDASGLLAPVEDTTSKAQRGGIYAGYRTTDPPTYDILSNSATEVRTMADHSYLRLFSYKPGTVLDPPGDADLIGEAVESWELTDDGTTLTMKLRPNMKYDPRPPTNGRVTTIEDVKWSWERYAALGPGAESLLNSKSPETAPVTSVSFPDQRTIVMKMAFPSSALYGMLASSFFCPYILPVEADGRFDARQEMRGAGPWMMTKYEPSVIREFQRNPNYYDAAKGPFLDGISYPLLSEAATRLAQLKAKAIWGPYDPGRSQVLQIKREVPELELRQTSGLIGQGGVTMMSVGKQPANQPLWQDVRLRHAMAYLIDRDTGIEAQFNVSAFVKEGLPIETGWHTHIPASWPEIWRDPKENKMGEVSKYFHYNPDEAAKLLRAAGKFGMDLTVHICDGSNTFCTGNDVEIHSQMLQNGGHFKVKYEVHQYFNDYAPNYIWDNANYEGVANIPHGGYPNWDAALSQLWRKTGRNSMAPPDGFGGKIDDLMARHGRELDIKKRQAIAWEWAEEMARVMPAIPWSGAGPGFTLNWPWVGNAGVHAYVSGTGLSGAGVGSMYYWYDKSKDTRAS
jgi:peptide/nickel transport system substrate-binding protein